MVRPFWLLESVLAVWRLFTKIEYVHRAFLANFLLLQILQKKKDPCISKVHIHVNRENYLIMISFDSPVCICDNNSYSKVSFCIKGLYFAYIGLYILQVYQQLQQFILSERAELLKLSRANIPIMIIAVLSFLFLSLGKWYSVWSPVTKHDKEPPTSEWEMYILIGFKHENSVNSTCYQCQSVNLIGYDSYIWNEKKTEVRQIVWCDSFHEQLCRSTGKPYVAFVYRARLFKTNDVVS